MRQIRTRYRALAPVMDERMRGQWAATEAQTYGWGGMSAVSEATGMSRNTIRKGMAEIAARKKKPKAAVSARLRKPGGGRKRLTEIDLGLLEALGALVEQASRGDPMSPLHWTCKSTTQLARELTRHGHPVSPWTVGSSLLKAHGYSLQSNRKTKEGASHPDRNAQFEHISERAQRFQQRVQPVVSGDTKKELIGPLKNAGREWRPKRASLQKSKCMTSRISSSARSSLTGSTTSAAMRTA